MSREIAATFQITKVYRVTTYGYSQDECFDNLENIKDEDLEYLDENAELIHTDYASF